MGATPRSARIRPPIVDGLFYPAERGPLITLVDRLLSESQTPEDSCFAVVSPHAGYEYAGSIMASSFKAMARRPVRTAVLIGPSHRDPVDGFWLPESDAFSTPLGTLPVDKAAAEALLACGPSFRRGDIPHLEEHCLEVHLPFLARLFPDLSILPILVGGKGASAVEALVNAFRLTFPGFPDYIAFVVSANMASYMKGKDSEAENQTLERLIMERDWRGIIDASEKRQISTCGAVGISSLLSLAGKKCTVKILSRGSTQEKEDEPGRIVTYAAIGLKDGLHSH